MHLTDNLWIYVVVVIYGYVMLHLCRGKTSNMTLNLTPMSQKLKIKTIKCRLCHKKFKVKSTDFDREIQTCVLTDCDLKARVEEINAIAVFPCQIVAANDSIVVTIEDPIVIKVNKHGIESRTLS